MVDASDEREFGMGRGKVFPAAKAGSLLNPVRKLVQPPDRLVRRLELAPSARVLEIGCGPGYFSPSIQRAVPNGELVVLDLQLAMLTMARDRLRTASGSGSSPVQADAMQLPFASGSLDAVLVVLVLGEVPDRERCVREIRRVLVPGGRVAFAETRRDGDFIPFAPLRQLVEGEGLAFDRRHGWRWEYTATFRRSEARR